MHFSSVVGYSCMVALASGVAIKDYGVFEELCSAPEGWEAVASPLRNNRINFRIALHAADPKALERNLKEISTPGSPGYGKHLDVEEAAELMQPHRDASQAVLKWLKSSGVKDTDIKQSGQWIHFPTTADQASGMMNTEFKVYRHLGKRSTDSIRTTKVELPHNVIPYVKMIHPTTRFDMMAAQSSVVHKIEDVDEDELNEVRMRLTVDEPADTVCNSTITPKCLMSLYKVGGVTVYPEKAGRVGVGGFLDQMARYSDLVKFTNQAAQWASSANFTWEGINGGALDQQSRASSSEANLDIQYTIALSHPVKNHFYSTKGLGPLVPDLDQPTAESNNNEPYLEFFSWLLKQKNIPHTLEFSYGENEQSVPKSYAQQVCDMIGQLGTRGVSVIFSSGDTGVGSACQTNDGKKTTRFLPTFPGACPYVTSIGGTVGVNPERAVGFSSGGFSDLWQRPWYQEQQVASYLGKLGDKWKGLYNAQGRGFPDVSAQGVNFLVVDKGNVKKISGTSASAPAIAGMVGLLNAKRLQDGQPALGFLNPWVYQYGSQIMTDITRGGSTGCTGKDQYSGLRTPVVQGATWAAVPGWDPVTGLGTPLFDQMLKVLPNAKSGGGLGDRLGSTPGQLTAPSPASSTNMTPEPTEIFPPTLPSEMKR